MKPIVIDVNCMTFQEIKDAINEAYQAGYDDGYKAGQRSMQLTWHGDPIVYTTDPNWLYTNKHEVTCSSNGADDLSFNSMKKQRDE